MSEMIDGFEVRIINIILPNQYNEHFHFVWNDRRFSDVEAGGRAPYSCPRLNALFKQHPALKDYVERFLALESFV
jgi:hypothetical protein